MIRARHLYVMLSPAIILACTSSTDKQMTPGHQDAAPSGGGDSGKSGKSVVFTGQIVLAPAFTSTAGAQGCVLDADPPSCATSGNDGSITLSLPSSSRTGMTMQYPDAIPELSPIATQSEDITLPVAGWNNAAAGVIIPNSSAQLIASLTGSELDASKGYVDLGAKQLNGGTVTIERQTTAVEWYSEPGALPKPFSELDGGALPADSSLLGFLNIDPGMVTFHAEKNGQPCEWHPVVWKGKEPGTVTVPIRPGTWTRLFEVHCD